MTRGRGPGQRVRRARDAAAQRLPAWLVEKVPRDHWEADSAFHRRRRVTTGVSVLGAGLLGVSLSTRPGSAAFYGLTMAVAGTWLAGGLASGPLHLGHIQGRDATLRRPVAVPVALGGASFGVFYGAALVCREIPVLRRAISTILAFADEGDVRLVLMTTLANGAAEEVFFRGALYAALGDNRPVAGSTAVYTLATIATRNPALVIAAALMGSLFGLQRRSSGGIQASILTHLTWSVLMLRYLPPLFREVPELHGGELDDLPERLPLLEL